MGVVLEKKKTIILQSHDKLSIRQQCKLLDINRSNMYYKDKEESDYNLLLMNFIDEEYTSHPFKGIVKMTKYLHDLGHKINVKRVRRLTRQMGLFAVYPQKNNLSKINLEHKIYPYLLRGIEINTVNQVWSTDITYIKLAHGFIYLVAVLDWYSRFVLSWKISNTLEADFCVEALEDALRDYGKADIFNTDQGSQFTSQAFTALLLENEMQISMDGKGRAFDNIFTERLWRTVKYEEVYINAYQSIAEAKEKLAKYFYFYNYERHHQSLNYKKPAEIYFSKN